MRQIIVAALIAVVAVLPAAAVEPDEVLADPVLETRARDISKQLRCIVCQNQSIDDSDAELARDLRMLVRERLQSGDSDDAVIGYVVSRYGDYVLLKPPFKLSTYGLWFGPLAILAIALISIIAYFRRQRRSADPGIDPARVATGAATQALSDDEKNRLDAILKEDE